MGVKTNKEIVLENQFLMEYIQGGILYSEYEPPFRLSYASEGMAKLSGYTVEELCNLVQMDIVHDDDIPALVVDVEGQFAAGDTFEVEYRLKRKDGSYVYVLDRAKVVTREDGRKYIYCLLTDISNLKEMQHALRLKEEKYKIAIEQSGNVIIECVLETGMVLFSENYKTIFGCQPPVGTVDTIANSGWVEDGYQNEVIKLFDKVVKTKETCEMELQIIVNQNRRVWCSLCLIPVVQDENLYSVIGCLKNINDVKNRIAHLTELSTKDSLTGIYNRYAIEEFVKNEIINAQGKGKSALLIFDIDYFKQVNDKKGHAYGDEVLKKIAVTIQDFLPTTAVLGRIGGDEFLIYASFTEGEHCLEELANAVVKKVKTTFEQDSIPITISVGGAWKTEKCDTFKELYRNADIALYETKGNGRNGYTLYKCE